MASSGEDTRIDVHLPTTPSNYEELFVQLRLFNVAQRRLLQAICDDASEADLKAYLDSTLVKITDGANEEQGDFAEERRNVKPRLGPELPGMLARGRVYEKALGEARNNTRIEKFLVRKIEKDADLTHYLSLNLRKVRRLKIACWAATCNLVHMVMALVRRRDEGDREFFYRVLTIAVEFEYAELVKRLTEVEEFDVNRGRRILDLDDVHLREVGKSIKRIVSESGGLYYYAFRDRLTPLNLAAKLGNVEMVNTFLASKRIGVAFSPEHYWALHWAAKMGHAEVVDAILFNKDVNAAVLMTVDKSIIVHRLSYGFDTSFDWIDGSDIGPFYKVSFTPLQMASLYGDVKVVKLLKEREEATIEYDRGGAALRIATEMRRDEIVEILMDIPEVEKHVKRLHRDRQLHVDATNTILVVAALISSVTFAGWLTPPLGYSPYFGSASLDAGAPTPSGTYPSFVSVEGHPIMKYFWVFNSLSFFFAIATLMVGATAAWPPKKDTYIGVVVPSLRSSFRLAYTLLTVSVVCVMGAFVSAGLVVLPPIDSYTTAMLVTVGIGMEVVSLAWRKLTIVTRIHDMVRKFLLKSVTQIQNFVQRACYQIPVLDPIGQICINMLEQIKETYE